MVKKLDFLAIADHGEIILRCDEIAQEFGYSYRSFSSVDEFMKHRSEIQEATFVLFSAENANVQFEMSGLVQVIKQVLQDTYILAVIDSKIDKSAAVYVKRAGANIVLQGNEVREASKLEFIASQKIKSSYLPLKVSELVPDSAIDCPLYHLMPLNQKYLQVIRPGETIQESKIAKLQATAELYFRREDADVYLNYCKKYASKMQKAAITKCRAQYLNLMKSYVNLVLLMTDQSEEVSFHKGAELYAECVSLSKELLKALESVNDPWEIINHSAVGDFGSVERAPAIAAYAGLLSLQSGIGNHSNAMIAALIADLGMMDLHPDITKRIKHAEKIENLDLQDLAEFQKHPILSVNKVLSRKLPLPDDVKSIILSIHERMDQKGFPSRPRPDKIPSESMIISISEEIDRRSVVKMGNRKKAISEVKEQIYYDQKADGNQISLLVLEKLKKSLNAA